MEYLKEVLDEIFGQHGCPEKDLIIEAVKKDNNEGEKIKGKVAEILPMFNEVFDKRSRVMSQKVVNYRQIKSSEDCRYDGLSLGEVMLRLDPYDFPTARAIQMRVFQGGGETNVAFGLSHTFGLRSAVVTALVDDEIGKNIRNQEQYAE